VSPVAEHPMRRRPWPRGELEYVDRCPVCACERRRPLYGGLEDRLFGAPGRWDLWRCSDCAAAYLDPRPSRDAIGRAYPGRYYTHCRPAEPRLGGASGLSLTVRLRALYLWAATRARPSRDLTTAARMLPLVPRLVRNEASFTTAAASTPRPAGPDGAPRLLDVGCGDATLVARMRDLGWEAEGIDIDPLVVKAAAARGLAVRLATLGDVLQEEPSPRFDTIVLDHVLEHLPDPVESLRIARRLLSPGGFVWIATPNLCSLGHRSFGQAWMPLDPPRHHVLFSPGALNAALRSAGFSSMLTQPAARTAHWVFAGSAALAEEAHIRRPGRPGLAVKALAADLLARRRPELAEELVIVATAQAG